MMKKGLFVLAFGIIFSMVGLAVIQRQSEAFTCNMSGGACGYFTDTRVSATYNVLPDPALQGVNSQTTTADKTTAFINAIHWFLFRSTYRASVGAAFIVDSMLHYRLSAGQSLQGPVGGGQGAGVSYAQAHYSEWVDLVNFYANPKSSAYGIRWAVWPSKQSFCSGRLDSGFDQNVNDVALYFTPAYGTSNCDYEYSHSMPEIQFFWSGGTFDIGTLCGNVQDSAGPIPGPDQMPTATITVACSAMQQQIATVNFSDPDGATTGYITINGWTSGTVGSGAARQIPIPTSVTSPTTVQNVYLHVRDVGPVAPPNIDAIFQAQTDVPCVSYGCTVTVGSGWLDPYTAYQATVKITTTGAGVPTGSTANLVITPPAGVPYNYNKTQGVSGSGSPVTTIFAGIPATGRTGQYTAAVTIVTSSGGTSCSTTFPVANLPYLQVYGGDVFAGASSSYSSGATSCVTNAQGGVFSWNDVANGFAGGGTQYAVQALGQIEHFATAQGATNVAPVGLSFANTYNPADTSKLNPSQGLFGGNFVSLGLDNPANCDFISSDVTSGKVTIVNSDLTIPITSVGMGTQSVYYVTGGHNVYISGDVSYAGTGGWTSISQIPYFKVVVAGGNIYVAGSVKQLDGLYVAEANGASGGHIYTCATNAGGVWAAVNPASAGYYSACNQQLTINGAFVANQVQFLRTNGSVGQAKLGGNHAAEVFNYTPELWLPRGSGTPYGGYAAIAGLPPVL